MDSETKRQRQDCLHRVIVQLVGEDSVHQTFREGQLSESDVAALKPFFWSGPLAREEVVREHPESPAALVLKQIYTYDDKGRENPFPEPQEAVFRDIKAEHVMDSPCFFVCLYATE